MLCCLWHTLNSASCKPRCAHLCWPVSFGWLRQYACRLMLHPIWAHHLPLTIISAMLPARPHLCLRSLRCPQPMQTSTAMHFMPSAHTFISVPTHALTGHPQPHSYHHGNLPLTFTDIDKAHSCCHAMQAIQPILNQLVDDIARDEQYLQETLSPAARYDAFTDRLLGVLRETRAARAARGARQIALGIHRSDYMLDAPSGRFLQVGRKACTVWGLSCERA